MVAGLRMMVMAVVTARYALTVGDRRRRVVGHHSRVGDRRRIIGHHNRGGILYRRRILRHYRRRIDHRRGRGGRTHDG
jgi:hypothetical protein